MTTGLIDVHFHLSPQVYRDAVYEAGTVLAIGRYPECDAHALNRHAERGGRALRQRTIGAPCSVTPSAQTLHRSLRRVRRLRNLIDGDAPIVAELGMDDRRRYIGPRHRGAIYELGRSRTVSPEDWSSATFMHDRLQTKGGAR